MIAAAGCRDETVLIILKLKILFCSDSVLLEFEFFFLRSTWGCRGRPGSRLLVLASPRKVSKRRRPQVRSPAARGSRWRQAQIGRENKLAALKQIFPLFPICARR